MRARYGTARVRKLEVGEGRVFLNDSARLPFPALSAQPELDEFVARKTRATLCGFVNWCDMVQKPNSIQETIRGFNVQKILLILKKFLANDSVVIITYLGKMLLYLSEIANDARVLSTVVELEDSLGATAEMYFPRNMVYNIPSAVSRMKPAHDKAARSRAQKSRPR